MLKHLSFAAVFIMSATVASLAFGDVIYDLNFNTGSNPNFDQADPTGISTLNYTSATGADGTTAVQVDFDTTADPFSVAYFTNLASSSVNAATSTNAADYNLSFDVRIEGFDADDNNIFTEYSITLGDEQFGGTLSSTATYQTVTANLGSLTNSGTGAFDLTDFTGTQQFRVSFLGLNNRFDLDNNNSYFIDNIVLSQVAVPEPTSLGLVAFGVLAIAGIRKRKI